MPQYQELIIQAPCLSNNRFHVVKEGEESQKWEERIYAGDTVAAFIPEREAWISTSVERWDIYDGSGNAPALNAHYFLKWQEQGNWMKYDLHAGLKVRMKAPTDEELIARSGWCEGSDWTSEYNAPPTCTPCSKRGEVCIGPSGQKYWFCDQHKPAWILSAE